MENSLLYSEVPYEEIIANWSSRKQWNEWKKCIYIAANIPYSRINSPMETKIRRFTDNYICEKAIADKFGWYFYDNTHSTFHTGVGVGTPDFITKDGITIELKQRSNFSSIPFYKDFEWHNADVHLIYIRKESKIYMQLRDGSLIYVDSIDINFLGE